MAFLDIIIGAKNDKLKSKVKETSSVLNKMAGNIARSFVSLFAFRTLQQVFTGLIGRFDELGKAARSIGVGVEKFQEYAFAARRNNMELGRFSQAFQKMQRNIDDAGDGLATASLAFKKMNLEYRDLATLSPEQQFEKVVDALEAVQNATTRVALANEIFGRSGRMVLNMARDYRALGDAARELGAIADPEDVQTAENIKDMQESIKSATMAAAGGTGILQTYLGIITKIRDVMTDIKKTGSIFQTLTGERGKTANTNIKGILTALNPTKTMSEQWNGLRAAVFGFDLDEWMTQGVDTKALTKREKDAFRKNTEDKMVMAAKSGLGGNALGPNAMNIGAILARDPALAIGGNLVASQAGGSAVNTMATDIHEISTGFRDFAAFIEGQMFAEQKFNRSEFLNGEN